MVSRCDGYEDHAVVDAADEPAAKEEFRRRYGLSEKAEITASEMVKSYDEGVFLADLASVGLAPSGDK